MKDKKAAALRLTKRYRKKFAEGGETDVDWSKLNQPLGELKGTAPEDTPVVFNTPNVKITEGDIDRAINVGMGTGPGIIAGEKSLTAPARMLGRAMSKEGFKDTPESIVKETGWYKGGDGKWRYEISDQGMKLADRDWKYGESGKLGDFVEHPELYKAYPEMRDQKFNVAEKDFQYLGSYGKESGLTINPDKVKGDDRLLDVLAHEMQHMVQAKEGFARGSSPDSAFEDAASAIMAKLKKSKDPAEQRELMSLYADVHQNARKFGEYMYLRAPGEVEANMVAARRQLSDEMRKKFSVKEHQKMIEGEKNTLHGGIYEPEFWYPQGEAAVKKYASGGGVMDSYRKVAHDRSLQGPIRSDVPGRTDKINANVPAGSSVVPADVVSALGQGNTEAGHGILDQMFKKGPYGMNLPRAKSGTRLGKRRSSLSTKFADGGETPLTPIIVAGGEHILTPEQVMHVGNGDLDLGHEIINNFYEQVRAKNIQTLKGLKGPKNG